MQNGRSGKDSGVKITINDIAEQLGVSKSTVSRSLSGKGRIGEKTKKMVLDYIEEHNYKPNVIARGLANSRTYNIGWIVPGDSGISALPFFDRSLSGIIETASAVDYDILITQIYDRNVSGLNRIIENRKVDGIILGRTLVDDVCVKILKDSGIPFVVIGSTDEKDVIQIDNDHISACFELASILALKKIKKFAYISGNHSHVVNRTRKDGFFKGLFNAGIREEDCLVYMDRDDQDQVAEAVDDALRNNADCIICSDDLICYNALLKLSRDGVPIPERVKIASLYNSSLLDKCVPPITALQYDPKDLGSTACSTLLDILDGKKVEKKLLLGYEVMLKGSTL